MDPTRASLILRLKDTDDVAAWDEFAAIYSPAIYRVAIRKGMQPADAENVVQEVLASVANSVSKWLDREDRGGFRAWLFAIARNESIDTFTRRATRPLGRDGETGANILAQVPARSELTRELELEYSRSIFQWAANRVRENIDEKNWQAFWLTSVEGMDINQAAKELEITTGQIYCARSRIMAKIKKHVQEYEAQK